MESKNCSSCGVEVLEEYTNFKCPGCGKAEVIRCKSCRKRAVHYNCSSCGFKGP